MSVRERSYSDIEDEGNSGVGVSKKARTSSDGVSCHGWSDDGVTRMEEDDPILSFSLCADEMLDDESSTNEGGIKQPPPPLDVSSVITQVPQVTPAPNPPPQTEDELELDPFWFMHSVPGRGHLAELTAKIVREEGTIPPAEEGSNKPCLVLDLDETLVHSSVVPIDNPDFTFPIEIQGQEFMVYARKRPHCDHFLRMVAQKFELVVFTASKKLYADRVLDLVDPSGLILGRTHRLFREHCLFFRGQFLKDLSVLNRDLKRTVIIDNNPHTFSLHVDNGIPIESWFDDSNDRELLELLPLLDKLHESADVRPVLIERFQMRQRFGSGAIGMC